MKTLTILSLATILLMPSWLSAQPGDREQGHGHGGEGRGGMMMGMMSDEQRAQMQAHMQEMRGIMEQIRETGDPARRRQLMQAHMETMRQGMQMMDGDMMGQGGNQGQGRNAAGDMSTEERMEMMQNRMGMMRMMMNQMMEHLSEMTGQTD